MLSYRVRRAVRETALTGKVVDPRLHSAPLTSGPELQAYHDAPLMHLHDVFQLHQSTYCSSLYRLWDGTKYSGQISKNLSMTTGRNGDRLKWKITT